MMVGWLDWLVVRGAQLWLNDWLLNLLVYDALLGFE
jgi:hypothetical protein